MSPNQTISLFIVSSFYASYFIKGMTLRKQGIASNRLAKGDKPSKARRLEFFLLIGTFLIAVVQYLSIFKVMPSVYHFPILTFLGLLIAALGLIIFIVSIITMRTNWRAGIDRTQKTELIKNGIYKYSRNPAFVGFDLIYIGITIANLNFIHVIAALFCMILFHLQILQEEKYLASIFGQPYINYKKTVRRYF